MKFVLLILLQALFLASFAQDLTTYKIYNSKGKKVKFKKMIKSLNNADVVLFGEYHNDAIAHWLQYETTLALQESNDLILAAEMFETDNQTALDKYLNGSIDRKALDTLARLWPNYKDYEPLVEFAKSNKLPFIASNVPRRYASLIFKQGMDSLESLDSSHHKYIAPLPIAFDIELSCYAKMLEMSRGQAGIQFPQAQAIKDATMAYSIVNAYQPESLVLHFNGVFHSDNYEGINWYIKQYNADLQTQIISMVYQDDISKLDEESFGVADFIICVDQDVPKTY